MPRADRPTRLSTPSTGQAPPAVRTTALRTTALRTTALAAALAGPAPICAPICALICAPAGASASTLTIIYQNPPSNTYAYDLQAVQPVTGGGLIVSSYAGGANGLGKVFLLTPGKSGQPWTQTDIHDFTGTAASPADGSNPSTLLLDPSGNVWGLTNATGANGGGTLFELIKPATKGAAWTYRPVGPLPASFTVGTQVNGKSGWTGALFEPSGNLDILAATNPLFCANVCGVLFQIPAANLAAGSTAFTTLYNFASGPTGNAGGIQPGGLARSKAGDFFGVYYAGGAAGTNGAGFVWELTPKKGVYTETILYNFCQLNQCADGQGPSAIALSSTNTLYGTYEYAGTFPNGGATAAGGTFKLSHGAKGWSYTNLYTLYGSNPGGSNTVDHDVQTPTGALLTKSGALIASVQRGGDTIDGGGVLCERIGGVVAFTLGSGADTNLSNGFDSEGGTCPNGVATSGPKVPLSAVAEGAGGVLYGSAQVYHNAGAGTDTHQNVIYQIK